MVTLLIQQVSAYCSCGLPTINWAGYIPMFKEKLVRTENHFVRKKPVLLMTSAPYPPSISCAPTPTPSHNVSCQLAFLEQSCVLLWIWILWPNVYWSHRKEVQIWKLWVDLIVMYQTSALGGKWWEAGLGASQVSYKLGRLLVRLASLRPFPIFPKPPLSPQMIYSRIPFPFIPK